MTRQTVGTDTHLVTWRRVDVPGHEVARLSLEGGTELGGAVALSHDGDLCVLEYRVRCDADWNTVTTHVAGSIGDRNVDIRITVDDSRRWRLNGVERPEVRGCLDIDLGFSPATNLLPIRRLGLAEGQAAEVHAAWLSFPGLDLEPLDQVYRRLGERTYHYESAGGRFVRILEVDDAGMVTSYPGLWEAV